MRGISFCIKLPVVLLLFATVTHGAMIAIRQRAKVGIDVRDQNLRHVIFKRGGHILHGL